MLDSDPCSAQNIFQRLRKEGYRGGVTILREYVRGIRPTKLPVSKKPTEHRSVGAGPKTSQHERSRRRASRTYTLRIEHIIHPTSQITLMSPSGKPSYLVSANPPIAEMKVQPNWSREFTVLGRHTLEQLNEIILHILGRERDHLYEFRFADRVHAHLVFLEEDTLFVDDENPATYRFDTSAFRPEMFLRTYLTLGTTTTFELRCATYGLRGLPKLCLRCFSPKQK